VLALCACASESEPVRWNVLLVTLDTTRADALGCYGARGDPTPHLDRFARSGTRFDQAVATAALTPVSHASILSGLDNRGHGLRVLAGRGGSRIDPHVPTLSTVLRARGWRTAAVHSSFTVSGYYGFDEGFDVFDSLEGEFAPGSAGNLTWNQPALQRRSDTTTDRAIAQITRGSPFFLWVHYWDAHDGSPLPPSEFLPHDLPRDGVGRLIQGRELYAAKVRWMDRQFGRLMAALEASGEAERTLVVVVADHGEGLDDHGWDSHRILYQEQIRVPLLVRVPGAKQQASTAALVRTTDIAPTVADYLGLGGFADASPPDALAERDLSTRMSGLSLRPYIEGEDAEARLAFADALNGYDLNVLSLRARAHEDFVYAVVEWPWKLLYRPLHPDRHELFDLERDPGELENRFASEPDRVLRMEKHLAHHPAWVAAPFEPEPGAGTGSGIDTERARQILSNLGYVEGTTSGSDARFAFACPVHRDLVQAEPRPCPSCSEPPILIAHPR
jgi:arylsulfatase A-like enzyme